MTLVPAPRRVVAAALALGVVLGAGACTLGSRPSAPAPASSAVAGPSAEPSPPPARSRTADPAEPLAVVAAGGEAERARAASALLFRSAPVVVVAPAGDREAQRLAAHVSVQTGVPLLVAASAGPEAGPDPALLAEVERLGATTVVVVGEAPAPDEGASGRRVVRAAATARAVADATGLRLGAGEPGDPAALAGRVAALAPGFDGSGLPTRADQAEPGRAGGDDDAALPALLPPPPLTDTVALAVDAPEEVAPIATARAAGVPVHVVPAATPDPQALPPVIEALHASPAAHVVALGAAWAGQPALDWKIRSARTGYQLPGGGQIPFPRHQMVALYGTPATSRLGVLGEQDLAASVERARRTAAEYAGLSDRTVVPMFEIIATVAAGSPGPDGNYSNEQPVEVLRPWVEAAGAAGIAVVLDLQPGRSDFLSQARRYEELLRLPHVGLALDPEWRLGPDELPLERIGSVTAAEINTVGRWLADLTHEHGLPPKLFVLHQFQLRMISDRAAVDTSRPELVEVIHVDGQGSQPAKQDTWRTLQRDAPPGVAWGWKNFIDEDRPVLSPQQTVSGVSPLPDLVTVQ